VEINEEGKFLVITVHTMVHSFTARFTAVRLQTQANVTGSKHRRTGSREEDWEEVPGISPIDVVNTNPKAKDDGNETETSPENNPVYNEPIGKGFGIFKGEKGWR